MDLRGDKKRFDRPARRAWRRNLRPLWRDLSGPIIVLTALSVIVLGTIGYLKWCSWHPEDCEPPYTLLDALYRAVGLFGLSGAVDPPIPVPLEIARIIAPVVAGIAVIRTLLTLARDRLRLFRLRYTAGNHVIVAGLGDVGFRLALTFHDAGFRVVAVEIDGQAQALGGCRERGITVIQGNASDPEVLRRTRPANARLLVAACGDDSTNVSIGVAAGGLASRRRSGLLTVLVHLGDTSLWRVLALESRHGQGVQLEPFSLVDTAARMMLDSFPPFDPYDVTPAAAPRILVVGAGEMVDRVLLNMARLWVAVRADGDLRLPVWVAGPSGVERTRDLEARYRHLPQVLELTPSNATLMELRTGAALPDIAEGTFSSAYVCLPHQANSLAAALAMNDSPVLTGAQIVATVNDDGTGAAKVLGEAGADNVVHPFGLYSRVLTTDLLYGGTTDTLARALHEDYVRTQVRAAGDPAANDSLVHWEDLDESVRESNRGFVDRIGPKLAAVACVLVSDPLSSMDPPAVELTTEEIEKLARLEHDRWADDLRDNGWRFTEGEADHQAKVHPKLVDWADLPEPERQKDRDAVVELPAMLARAGMRMVRLSGSA